MKKPAFWIVALTLFVFVAVMVMSTRGLSQYRVEVCMEFQGREACRTASAATEEQALRTATDNACAQISSGMTDSIACSSSQPRRVQRLDKK